MPPAAARHAAAAASSTDAAPPPSGRPSHEPLTRLAFTKSDDTGGGVAASGSGSGAPAPKVRHKVTVLRDDGSVTVVPMADYGPVLPHDLAHFVVERELGVRFGFWGLVVAGAQFDTLARAAKGAPPQKRSDPMVAAHRDELLVAEALVNLLHRPNGGGSLPAGAGDDEYQAAIAEIVSSSPTAGLAVPTVQDVHRVRAGLTTMARRWRDLAPGHTVCEDVPT
jgi:hypothetical protein